MVGFALAMLLLVRQPIMPSPAVAARHIGLEVAAYRSTQVFDLAATGFDVTQTWRGLGWHNPLEYEAGDARWFVNPRSQGQVSAFLVAQEALVLFLAARLQRRRGWLRWAAPLLLGYQAISHVQGGVAWYAWKPYNPR